MEKETRYLPERGKISTLGGRIYAQKKRPTRGARQISAEVQMREDTLYLMRGEKTKERGG